MAQTTRKQIHYKRLPGIKRTVVVFLAGALLVLSAAGALAAAAEERSKTQDAAANSAEIGTVGGERAGKRFSPGDAASIPDKMKDAIKTAILNCQTEIDVSEYQLSNTEEAQQMINDYAKNGSPLFFNVDMVYAYYVDNRITDVKIVYKYGLPEFKNMQGEVGTAAAEILNGIRGNNSLGAVEKALLIHDRIALRCEYNMKAANAASLYGALVSGKAQCAGYAKAYWYLLEQVGIDCMLVESRALDHMWNIVYIDGKPYHVDVTADDNPYVEKIGDIPQDITGWVTHDNFLRSSKGIYECGHKASDYNTTPSDTKYDAWFWQNSQTAFVLLGNNIYYIDNNSGTLNRYSDRKTLRTINAVWPNYKKGSNYSIKLARLCTDGKDLFYNTDRELIRYTAATGATESVHTFSGSGKSVVGFSCENGWFIGEYTADGIFYTASTKAKDGFRFECNPVPANLGDVDGNGKVDSADARMALRASVKLEPTVVDGTDAFKAADIDGNNKIESADARTILRLSVKLEKMEDIKAKYGK